MSAGGLFGMIINFCIVGGACLAFSKLVDVLVNLSYISIKTQDAINTIELLKWAFTLIPFLYLILLVYNHVVVSNSEINQEV